MQKDAYYFPHFSNARNDRKLKRVIKELGVEGYGIYFMILEVLRDQSDFKYPLEDIDLLADEFNTSEQKVRTVISNYKLFKVDEDNMFFSLKFEEFMQPYLIMKNQRKQAGIKSGKVRALAAKTPKEEKHDLPQVYIINCFNGNETFIKIGSTKTSISRRFSGHLPYDYKVIRQIFSEDYISLEDEMSQYFTNYRITPRITFAGNNECYDIKILNEIINYTPVISYSHERVFERCLNENEQSKVKERKEKKKNTPFDDAVDEFKRHRKQMKSPMTEHAVKLFVSKLDKFAKTDDEKIAIINQSIENGWKGIFELKETMNKSTHEKVNRNAPIRGQT